MISPGFLATPSADARAGREALKHFATAFLFLLVGLVALVWNSGRLSEGSFGDPRVIGGIHWLTLGWLSLSIFGAVRVFTGVALGSQGSGIDLAPWVRRVWMAGALLFSTGLTAGTPPLIVSGVLMIGIALLLFTYHLLPAILRATRGGVTRWYLAIALFSLWCAWVLGGLAAFIRAGHPLGALPAGYLHAHLLVAVFGWVGATVVGVGSHLIPMFALSREPTQWPSKLALPLWALLPVLALFSAFRPQPFVELAWIDVGACSFLWIIQVAIYFRTRLRRERDPGLFLAGGATALLAVAWIALLLTNTPVPFVGLLVVGWLSLFTLGIYHRVVPFLAWYARFARGPGRGPVPRVKDLLNERIGYASAVTCLFGALLWGSGLAASTASIVYSGSALILLGATACAAQVFWLTGSKVKGVSAQ